MSNGCEYSGKGNHVSLYFTTFGMSFGIPIVMVCVKEASCLIVMGQSSKHYQLQHQRASRTVHLTQIRHTGVASVTVTNVDIQQRAQAAWDQRTLMDMS